MVGCKREELSLNEADFLRSIGEILTKKLTKDNATDQWVRDSFDHPDRNEEEILRAVRLAVFGKFAGLNPDFRDVHWVNRAFAFWTIAWGLKKKLEPWVSLKSPALNGADALMFDHAWLAKRLREAEQ